MQIINGYEYSPPEGLIFLTSFPRDLQEYGKLTFRKEKMNEYCEKAQVSMQQTEGDYHFYCGRLLLIQRKCRIARWYFFKSIISWPFNFVPFIFLFVTLLPTVFLDRLENFWK